MASVPGSEKKAKKPQSVNFSEDDKIFLARLLKNYIAIINNKRIDGNAMSRKNKAWSTVQSQYNKFRQPERTVDQLQTAWKNMKVINFVYLYRLCDYETVSFLETCAANYVMPTTNVVF